MIGTAIGAGLSALSTIGGLMSNRDQEKARQRALREAKAELQRQQTQSANEYGKSQQQLEDYYANRKGIGSASDVNAYRAAIAGYDPNKYVPEETQFEYDKSQEDFINPYYNKIIGDTAAQIQHSAAGAGLGRGTGAALGIAKGVAEKSDELYKTAADQFNSDRDFTYKTYSDAIANNRARLEALRSGDEFKLGLTGDLAKDYVNTQDERQSDLMKLNQDRMAANQAYGLAMGSLY